MPPSADGPVDHEGARVDQHLAQATERPRRPAQQQQRCLRRHQHAHLVGDHLALAADEGHLAQQHLHVALQLPLLRHRQAAVQRHAPAQQCAPGRRKRRRRQPRPPPRRPQRWAGEPAADRQHEQGGEEQQPGHARARSGEVAHVGPGRVKSSGPLKAAR
jgi:hypothetical protein